MANIEIILKAKYKKLPFSAVSHQLSAISLLFIQGLRFTFSMDFLSFHSEYFRYEYFRKHFSQLEYTFIIIIKRHALAAVALEKAGGPAACGYCGYAVSPSVRFFYHGVARSARGVTWSKTVKLRENFLQLCG